MGTFVDTGLWFPSAVGILSGQIRVLRLERARKFAVGWAGLDRRPMLGAVSKQFVKRYSDARRPRVPYRFPDDKTVSPYDAGSSR